MKRFLTLLLSVVLSCSLLYPKVIIWDIGGVLLDASSFALGRTIGLSHFFSYMIFDWKSPKIQPLIFEVLDMMDCPKLPDSVNAFTSDGIPLPPIICHWQAGTLSGKHIIEQSRRHIRALSNEGFFISYREEELVQKTIEKMFDPQSLADCTFPIYAGINLLRQCADEVTPEGNPKNMLIALSNWDPDSFPLVRNMYPDLFDNFDFIAISGRTGFIKPRSVAFTHLIQNYNLNPQDCLVIDDQKHNLEMAKKLGFETFHLERANYGALRRVLRESDALS